MPRLCESQKVCYRADCEAAWKKKLISSRFLPSALPSGYRGTVPIHNPLKSPIKQGLKRADNSRRGVEWAIGVNKARIHAPRRVLDAVSAGFRKPHLHVQTAPTGSDTGSGCASPAD
jgi:hypothetical protein